MNISIVPPPPSSNQLPFGEIHAGQLFMWEDHLHMKLMPVDAFFNAVELHSGRPRSFTHGVEVRLPKEHRLTVHL